MCWVAWIKAWSSHAQEWKCIPASLISILSVYTPPSYCPIDVHSHSHQMHWELHQIQIHLHRELHYITPQQLYLYKIVELSWSQIKRCTRLKKLRKSTHVFYQCNMPRLSLSNLNTQYTLCHRHFINRGRPENTWKLGLIARFWEQVEFIEAEDNPRKCVI